MRGQSVRPLMIFALVLSICCLPYEDAHVLGNGNSGGSDFEINVVPRFKRAIRGGDALFTVQFLSATNHSGTLQLRVDGLHGSMTAFFPPSVSMNQESFVRIPVRILTSAATPLGTYDFNVTVTKDTVEHTITVEVSIHETFFGVLELVVTDTSGNRVPEAFVAAYYKCCLLARPPDEPEAVGITDSNGTIELPDLLEGRYSVGAFAEGYYEGGAIFEVFPGQETTGTLSMKVRPWIYDWGQLIIVPAIAAVIMGAVLLVGFRPGKIKPAATEDSERKRRPYR